MDLFLTFHFFRTVLSARGYTNGKTTKFDNFQNIYV